MNAKETLHTHPQLELKEIINAIVKKYPLSLQEKWDESGIRYVPPKFNAVTGVLLCLDIDKTAIEVALRNDINLIISHHPIFTENKDYKMSKYDKEILASLKANKIAFVSYHTNVDNSPIGLSYYIAKELNLQRIQNIGKNGIVTGSLNTANRAKVFGGIIKNKFSLERIIFHNVDSVKNIAICAGAGFDIIKGQLDKLNKIDLFVTADLKYHDWKFAKKHGLQFMDIGHDVENVFLDLITNLLIEEFKTIKIQKVYSKTEVLVG
ncbi:MAG: Nif3-like dinuclear metal center hexameric protein [Mycoplasmataceae bacterium]|nr:Nif3-like dinuclear metal center hexameric protein [Mycoplasmataceae bacterium]